jgi:hypothetical protein
MSGRPVPVEDLQGQVDALGRPQATAAQEHAAAAVVHAHATGPDDEALLLDALGLTGRPMRSNRRSQGTLGTVTLGHGTRSGVQAHQAAGTPLCDPCRRWQDVQDRKQLPGHVESERRPPQCGSHAAWRAHLDAGEELDAACRQYADWRRGRHHSTEPIRCGTEAAYERHRRRGEPIDEACRKGRSAVVVARRQARRQAAADA